MKDLAKAMGRKWCDHKWVKRSDNTYFCSQPNCVYGGAAFYDHETPRNPSPTDKAFCWRALQYMMGRGDWARFYHDMWYKYTMEQRAWTASGYIPWLLDPARFIKLANEWCREHPEKGE